MSKPKLEPCPFCGETPQICHNAPEGDPCRFYVACRNEACRVAVFTDPLESEEAVAELWNRSNTTARSG